MIDEAENTEKVKILLAEDEMIVAEDLALTLQNLGYQIVGMASTGEEVIQLAKESSPHLILMDIKLAGHMDGIQASEQIRIQLDIPVIFITAFEEEDVLRRAKQAQPYGYMTKPFANHILKIVIDTALHRHAADRRLRDSEERYRLISETANMGIFTTSLNGSFLQANPAVAKMFGYDSVEEFLDVRVQDLYSNVVDRQRFLNDLLENGSVKHYEILARKKDGTPLWVSLNAVIQKDRAGAPAGILGIVEDITSHKRAVKLLEQAEQRYRRLFEDAPLMSVITRNEQGAPVIIGCNELFLRSLGYSREEVVGQSLARFYSPTSSADLLEGGAYARAMEGEYFIGERQLLKRDGTLIPTLLYTAPEASLSGEVIGTCAMFVDITEQKRAEEALLRSEEQLSNALIMAHLGHWEYDVRKDLFTFNDHFYRIFHTTAEQVGGYTMSSADYARRFVHPEDQALVASEIRKALETTDPDFRGQLEHRIVYADGGIGYITVRHFAVKDDLGRTVETYGVNQDITDRKLSEQALRKSQEQLRTIFETSPAGIFLVSPEGRIILANRRMGDLFSRRPEELIGTHYVDLIHPSQRSIGHEKMKSLMAGKIDHVSLERRYVVGDGREFVGRLSGRSLLRPDGGLDGLVGIITDITDLKAAEESLRESMDLLQYIVMNDPNAIAVYDMDLHYLAVSKRYLLDYNVEEEDIIGKHHYEIFPEVPQRWKDMHQRCLSGAVESEDDDYFERPDGTITYNRWECRPWYRSSGEVGGIITYTEVTTDRKLAEKALRESEEKYRRLFDNSPVGILSVDAEGRILEVNQMLLEILGSPSAQATKAINMFDLPNLVESGISEAFRSCMATGERLLKHIPYMSKWGKQSYLRIVLTPVTDEEGTIHGCQAIMEDITQQRELEEQLRQAQKMEAIGTLAGGIAHDFNNLLQVTLGYSELLLQEKTEDDADYGDLQKIFHAARSGADLVRRLLAFGRKAEPKPIPMNLNREIRHIEKLLHRTIPRMIDIRLDLAEDLETISADPAQIEQIIMNLAVNARDAMGEEGCLTLRSENVTLDDQYCRYNVEAKPGDYVLLSVSDTGHGMDKETLQHIFEPFYTTKEVGRGTGLGLAMVYGIVRQHGGHIDCHSEEGKGTTFKLYFPAVPPPKESAEETKAAMPAVGTETVLLVDDEDLVREFGERILTRSGYTVITATNGEEALQMYTRQNDHIALVILDLLMPKMGGKDCLKRLLEIDSHAKVLIASGYAGDTSTKEILELGAKGFIAKPIKVRQMLEAVRNSLDGP
jgi:PAS domain S-box-containing protein